MLLQASGIIPSFLPSTMPYCCCGSEPYMGLKDSSFPVLPCNFKNRSGGVHELCPHPHPTRLLTHGCDQCWVQRKTAGCGWVQALLWGSRWQARQLKHHTSPQTSLTIEHFLFRSGSLCMKEDDSREGSCHGDKHSQEL